MDLRRGNFLSNIPAELSGELSDPLLSRPGLRVERIVSRGDTTPEGEWYDQQEHEWVCVLSGAARIELEGREELLELVPGDWVQLPAHVRHRVAWTSTDVDTIWIAIFLSVDSL